MEDLFLNEQSFLHCQKYQCLSMLLFQAQYKPNKLLILHMYETMAAAPTQALLNCH